MKQLKEDKNFISISVLWGTNRVQIFLPQIKIRKPSAKQQSVSIIFFKSDHAEHLYLASPLNCECKYE